ncbi:hypothetical protein RVM26_05795 [Halomonas sp. KM072]
MVQRWPLSLRFRFLALLGSVLLCAMLALGALSHHQRGRGLAAG